MASLVGTLPTSDFFFMTTQRWYTDTVNTKGFRRLIWNHYHKHGRDLPWRPPTLKLRKDKLLDPYTIFVSEIMLQQTHVARVLEKYPQFIRAFPNIRALARAPLRDILRVWQGMGYNRRALYLKRAAEIIVQDYGEKIPSDPAVLAKIPGIGKNTAGAIATFAFNQPTVFIETNIRRAFIYHFGNAISEASQPMKARGEPTPTPPPLPREGARGRVSSFYSSSHMVVAVRIRKIHDREILPLVAQTLDRKNPREWYWALIDYGAALSKLVHNPNRKSAHYAKPSKFKGSHRQLRGAIIQALLQKPATLTEMIKRTDGASAPRTRECIQTLMRDGLVQKRNGTYHIGA